MGVEIYTIICEGLGIFHCMKRENIICEGLEWVLKFIPWIDDATLTLVWYESCFVDD